jgi:hypothetical protein
VETMLVKERMKHPIITDPHDLPIVTSFQFSSPIFVL